jgi:hypothetical protein
VKIVTSGNMKVTFQRGKYLTDRFTMRWTITSFKDESEWSIDYGLQKGGEDTKISRNQSHSAARVIGKRVLTC